MKNSDTIITRVLLLSMKGKYYAVIVVEDEKVECSSRVN